MKLSMNGKKISFKKLPDGIVKFKTITGVVYQVKYAD